MYFEQSGSVRSVSGSLSYNLSWEDQIVEDRLMDGGQASGVRSLLLMLASSLLLSGNDLPLCDDDDLLARKLLLEFSHESCLNLVEGEQQWARHEDHDDFAAARDVDLLCGGKLERLQVCLELGGVLLEVPESLGDGFLQSVHGGAGRLPQLGQCGHGCKNVLFSKNQTQPIKRFD
eukprot:CAMPEP_0184691568 /NCGR_PEP_ID=MMETSP0313-20130426/382_1 /TAXON_ID=2792 /ORGANISM="Porphyridium aerugineum, Strain SAG 1380-2" /LENGTH=175 /DNA_ID=CAMNT_0027149311 /DNA_START=207 /DNA_END=734 /DNA_ORIENTATION=-